MPTSIQTVAKPRRRLRAVLVVAGVLLLLAAALFLRGIMLRSDAVNRDFISYWSTGRLLAQHHNPYDRSAILQLERAQGAHFTHPMIMRNPPWALYLALPLAWFSLPTAAFVWMIAIIASALLALHLLRPASVKATPLTLCFFAPSIICVGAEQTALFTLLGFVLLIQWQQRRPFAAGLALTLCMLKPHLLVLVWLVLLLQIWQRKQLRLLAGAAMGLAVTSAIGFAFDPHVWAHYWVAMRAERLDALFCPNLSTALRFLLAPRALWLESLPTLAAAAFTLWFWRRHRSAWSWSRHGAMLAALSVLTTPYSWPFDQVLFLPSMMEGLPRTPRRAMLLLAAANIAAIALYVRRPFLEDPLYLWMAPAWMLWCIYVYRRPEAKEAPQRPEPVSA